MNQIIIPALYAAAAGQLCIALLNLALPRIMHWEPDLQRLPLLVREVFHVHAWYISITLTIFALLTMRFAPDLIELPFGRWFAASVAVFWLIRVFLQVGYYSSSHWRGRGARTFAHVTLLAVYGGFAATYGLAAFAG